MNKRIIYKNDEGGISIIVPTKEALDIYGLEAIAAKDVPAGKPYAIVDAADIPEDRTFRAAWIIDEAALTDGVGAEWNTFDEVQA